MWAKILVVLCVGVSMKLVSPPIGWYWLHWFNLVPAFLVLRNESNKTKGWLMYGMGVSLIASNYYWISESIMTFSNLPVFVAWICVLLYALFFGLPFWVLGYSVGHVRKKFGSYWIWLVPAVQVTLEHVWPALFPYYHGALFYRSTWTWQLASVLGVMGVSYLILLSNCVCTELIFSFQEKRPLWHKQYTFVVSIFVGHLLFGIWRVDTVEQELAKANTIRVAILQQNVTMTYRLERNPWYAIRDWGKQTFDVATEKPDLVVWPEGALGGPINPDDERPAAALNGQSLKEFFSTMTSRYDFALLVGGGTINFHDELDEEGYPTYTAYNSCYLFNRKGEITGRYDKMVPLPFGEYIPFADTFPVLRSLIKGPGNFRAGNSVTYFTSEGKDFSYSFSTPICYEAILQSQMEKMSNTDLFINITNDAWFGNTAAPHQHAMLTTVQAIQYGRPLFRLAYTGVSFVVEPHGKILYETKPFEEVTTTELVRLGKIDTLYNKGGWLFPWLCLVGNLYLLVQWYRERQTNHQIKTTH